jgi:hypothetical protein
MCSNTISDKTLTCQIIESFLFNRSTLILIFDFIMFVKPSSGDLLHRVCLLFYFCIFCISQCCSSQYKTHRIILPLSFQLFYFIATNLSPRKLDFQLVNLLQTKPLRIYRTTKLTRRNI